MSKPVNAMAIGAFLVGGAALMVVALLVFGSGQFFKAKLHWVVYFDTSLNGLNVGAPVKVQGVQVGIVKEIELQLDSHQQKLMKPVVLEIEPWRLASPDGSPYELSRLSGEFRREEVRKLIEAGLRARLEVQSILTGLLYVDLDFHPREPLRLTGLNFKDMPEIPSIPPTVDEVMSTLEGVVKQVGQMPLEQMVGDMALTLTEIRKLVMSEETRKSQAALARSLTKAQDLLTKLDERLPSMVAHLDEASAHFGETARETTLAVREVNTHLGPVMKAAEQTLLKATDALEATRAAANNVADSTGDDSTLQSSVAELRRAAQSLRQLTDYLERHPDALLFGKSD